MTTFARTWNAGYEANPADGDLASEGANRIRDLKTDIQERGEVDHSWAGDADDGEHKKVTYAAPLGADPTNAANKGFTYTKDVSAKVELFWEDEDGNVIQLTAAGSLNPAAPGAGFPAGTRCVFHQTAAPTGWTKDTDSGINDKGLRTVTGTVGSGGTDDFSTCFSSSKATEGYVLLATDLPELTGSAASDGAHGHSVSGTIGIRSASGAGGVAASSGGTADNTTPLVSGSAASGGAHTHTVTVNSGTADAHAHDITLDLAYNDVIIAQKD